MASLKNAFSRSGNYKVEPFYQCLLIPLASLDTKINQNQQLMFFIFEINEKKCKCQDRTQFF